MSLPRCIPRGRHGHVWGVLRFTEDPNLSLSVGIFSENCSWIIHEKKIHLQR